MVALGLALLSRSSSTTGAWPCDDAQCSGVACACDRGALWRITQGTYKAGLRQKGTKPRVGPGQRLGSRHVAQKGAQHQGVGQG